MKIYFITITVLFQTVSCQLFNQNSQPNESANFESSDLTAAESIPNFLKFSPFGRPDFNNNNNYKSSGLPQGGPFAQSSQNFPNVQGFNTVSSGPTHYKGTEIKMNPVQHAYEHGFGSKPGTEDTSKPISLSYGSSGPSFMRLLLGSMGIHLGGVRLRNPLGSKPSSGSKNPSQKPTGQYSGSSPFSYSSYSPIHQGSNPFSVSHSPVYQGSSPFSASNGPYHQSSSPFGQSSHGPVYQSSSPTSHGPNHHSASSPQALLSSFESNGPYSNGPSNPAHFGHHNSVQEPTQQQQGQYSTENVITDVGGNPGDYPGSFGSTSPITVHHYYQNQQSSNSGRAPSVTIVAPNSSGIENFKGSDSSASVTPYSNDFLSAPPEIESSIDSPNSFNSYSDTRTKPEPEGSYNDPHFSYAKTYEPGSSSGHKGKNKDSRSESTELNSAYEDTLSSPVTSTDGDDGPQLKPYTVIEKPVYRYIEKPIVRYVEKTVYRTVEKPVVKYVEKPVIKYVHSPAPLVVTNKPEVHVHKDKSTEIMKSVEPELRASNVISVHQKYPTVNYSQPPPVKEISEDFYSSYGGEYFRKHPILPPKIRGAKDISEDNAFKKPIIHIPKELPAYSPSASYKVIKTHVFGPTISGEGLDIPIFGRSTGESKKATGHEPSPRGFIPGEESFLI